MARREWAEKRVDQLIQFDMSFADETDVVWLLKLEHARAVRIVKAKLKAAWLDKHSRTVEQRNAYTDACEDILAALQKGRA